MILSCQFFSIFWNNYWILYFLWDKLRPEGVIAIASIEQLRKVALYCDKYDPYRTELSSSARSYEDKYENCVNCNHYDKEGKCTLNLIDPILTSMAMELNLKS